MGEKEIESGFLKLKNCQEKSYEGIKKIIIQIKKELEEHSRTNKEEQEQEEKEKEEDEKLKKFLKEKNNLITEHLKNYHTQISKYSKVLDKIPVESSLEFSSPNLNSKVDPYLLFCIEYLIRTAQRQTVETIVNLGHYQLNEAETHHLYSISPVLESLAVGCIDTAEDWVYSNAIQINDIEESEYGKKFSTDIFAFEISSLRFLTYLSAGNLEQYQLALMLSQSIFPYFLSTYPDQFDSRIAELMGCLLVSFPSGLSLSSSSSSSSSTTSTTLPWIHLYPHLTIEKSVQHLKYLLIEASAQIHGLPAKGQLESLVRTGMRTLPTIRKALNLKAFNNAQNNENEKNQLTWSDLQDLPLEYPDDENLIFHTVFCCPVSRETATVDNPPVLLTCGHAILKSSMRQLPKRGNGRFKCPTCYSDTRSDDVIELHL